MKYFLIIFLFTISSYTQDGLEGFDCTPEILGAVGLGYTINSSAITKPLKMVQDLFSAYYYDTKPKRYGTLSYKMEYVNTKESFNKLTNINTKFSSRWLDINAEASFNFSSEGTEESNSLYFYMYSINSDSVTTFFPIEVKKETLLKDKTKFKGVYGDLILNQTVWGSSCIIEIKVDYGSSINKKKAETNLKLNAGISPGTDISANANISEELNKARNTGKLEIKAKCRGFKDYIAFENALKKISNPENANNNGVMTQINEAISLYSAREPAPIAYNMRSLKDCTPELSDYFEPDLDITSTQLQELKDECYKNKKYYDLSYKMLKQSEELGLDNEIIEKLKVIIQSCKDNIQILSDKHKECLNCSLLPCNACTLSIFKLPLTKIDSKFLKIIYYSYNPYVDITFGRSSRKEGEEITKIDLVYDKLFENVPMNINLVIYVKNDNICPGGNDLGLEIILEDPTETRLLTDFKKPRENSIEGGLLWLKQYKVFQRFTWAFPEGYLLKSSLSFIINLKTSCSQESGAKEYFDFENVNIKISVKDPKKFLKDIQDNKLGIDIINELK